MRRTYLRRALGCCSGGTSSTQQTQSLASTGSSAVTCSTSTPSTCSTGSCSHQQASTSCCDGGGCCGRAVPVPRSGVSQYLHQRCGASPMRLADLIADVALRVGNQLRHQSSLNSEADNAGVTGEILLFYLKNPLRVYDFEVPRYITRDHVAYARCPCCLHPFHMCSMRDHIEFEHADEITNELVFLKTCNSKQSEGGDDVFSGRGGIAEGEAELEALVEECKSQVRVHIDRICEKRLQMYEAYFGKELVKEEQDVVWERKEAAKRDRERLGRKFSTGDADGEDNNFFGTGSTEGKGGVVSAPKFAPNGVQIPQLNAAGDAYLCCYCPPPLPGSKPQVFRTRDMLFKHICTDHDEIDIEDIEDHVPIIVVKPGTAAVASTVPPGASPATPQQPPTGAVRRPVAAQPPGVGTRPEDAPPTKDALTGLINIDRYRIDQFPCEICGKVYTDEGDLLKHLELKHPISPSSVERNQSQMTRNPDEVRPPAGTSQAKIMSAAEAAAAAKFAVAALQKKESTRGKDVMISVKCDLCVGKQKVYTSGSALLAHLMGKHPQVNAALKIKELLAAADKTEANRCPHCDKIFSTQDALQSHITTKHEGITNANTRTSVSAGNNWWCNECDKGFTSPQGLRGHQHSKHGFVTVPVKCPICKRMCPDNFACDEHIKLSHPTARWSPSNTYNCFECPRGFLSPEDRDVHMKRYHPVVDSGESLQSINERRYLGTQKVKSVSRGSKTPVNIPAAPAAPIR